MVPVYSGLLSFRVLEYVKTTKNAVEQNKLVPLVFICFCSREGGGHKKKKRC